MEKERTDESPVDSGLLCLVVPTNEELMIARETALLTT